jgi:four helix bundle protein
MPTGLDGLKIYKLAEKLEVFVYKLTKDFPLGEKYRSLDQLNRSSSAVSNNIVEGYGRYSFQDKINKFYIARAEAEETRKGLERSYKKSFILEKQAELCEEKYTQLIKQINAYINFLKRQKKSSSSFSNSLNNQKENPNPQVPKSPSSRSKAFSLIELVISLGILVLVILAAMGVYLRVIGTREQSLGELNIQEEGQYIMGLIVKDIRAGVIDYDSYGVALSNPEDELWLLDLSSSANQIRYRSDLTASGDCSVERCKLERCKKIACGESDYEEVTMNEVSLERLDFYIRPFEDPFVSGSEIYVHPRVTVVLGLKSMMEATGPAEIVIQQTVSQRYTLRK